MKNLAITFILSLVFLLGTNQTQAQSNPGFSFAKAPMLKALKAHLKANPVKGPAYKLAADQKPQAIKLSRLLKAYDLNPNDLSFKAGASLENSFLIIMPLASKPGSRLKSDAMRLRKVQNALEGVFPSRNFKAAFILTPNGLGNFEIQDLM